MSQAMNERQFSEISIPDMNSGSGEFKSPKRDPVQLTYYHSEPNRNSYVSEPPPSETARCTDTDFDQNAAPTYLQWSEISSKKREYYDEIDNYARRPQTLMKKQNQCLVSVAFCVAVVALVMGLGGLGIGVYQVVFASSSEDCSCDDPANITALETQLAATQAQIEQLMATVANLTTSNNVEDCINCNNTRVEQLEQQVEGILLSLEVIQNPPTTNPPTTTEEPTITGGSNSTMESNTTEEFNTTSGTPTTTFKAVSLYENCTTTRLRSCPVSTSLFNTPPSFGTCQTSPPAPMNIEGFFNLGFHCAVTNPRTEQNPIITTLQVDETNNEVTCLCYVDVNNGDFARATVDCALYATRCPYTLYIPTDS